MLDDLPTVYFLRPWNIAINIETRIPSSVPSLLLKILLSIVEDVAIDFPGSCTSVDFVNFTPEVAAFESCDGTSSLLWRLEQTTPTFLSTQDHYNLLVLWHVKVLVLRSIFSYQCCQVHADYFTPSKNSISTQKNLYTSACRRHHNHHPFVCR
jgi:hypothetical protein